MLPLSSPSKLGRYEIVEEIGKGAMGVVYLARDPLIGRLVALKTFRIGYSVKDAELEQFRARFIREAQSAGILSHPNIVTIHDVVERGDEGMAVIAMEYVRGTNLKSVLQESQRPTLTYVVEVLSQIADGLDYAHSCKVIHRDIKPANILITTDHKAKITDFGIARLDTSNLTQEGQLLGTPNYMSPEQILGRDVDHRADIFSLGVVLYEMVTRHKPFQGDNLTMVSHRIVYDHFTPPREYVDDLPPGTEQILAKALEKDPARRYQRAREMADDLRKVVGSVGARDLLNETQSLSSTAMLSPAAAAALIGRAAGAAGAAGEAAAVGAAGEARAGAEEAVGGAAAAGPTRAGWPAGVVGGKGALPVAPAAGVAPGGLPAVVPIAGVAAAGGGAAAAGGVARAVAPGAEVAGGGGAAGAAPALVAAGGQGGGGGAAGAAPALVPVAGQGGGGAAAAGAPVYRHATRPIVQPADLAAARPAGAVRAAAETAAGEAVAGEAVAGEVTPELAAAAVLPAAGLPPARPVPWGGRLLGWPSQRAMAVAASAGVLLGLALAGGLMLWQRTRPAVLGTPAAAAAVEVAQARVVALLRDGWRRLEVGDADGAVAAFHAAEQLAPGRRGLQKLRGEAERLQSDTRHRLDQEHQLDSQINQGRQALTDRNYDLAEAAAQAVLAMSPGNSVAEGILSAAKAGRARARDRAASPARQAARTAEPPPLLRPDPAAHAEPPVAAPSTEAKEATVELAFFSQLPEGSLMIYVNGRKALQESFRFYEKSGLFRSRPSTGWVRRSFHLAPGNVEIRVYVTPHDSAAVVRTLAGNLPGGGSRRLDVQLSDSGQVSAQLN